ALCHIGLGEISDFVRLPLAYRGSSNEERRGGAPPLSTSVTPAASLPANRRALRIRRRGRRRGRHCTHVNRAALRRVDVREAETPPRRRAGADRDHAGRAHVGTPVTWPARMRCAAGDGTGRVLYAVSEVRLFHRRQL